MKITPVLALTTVLGTLGYLGLAVWGEGGFSAFFAHGALTAIVALTLALAGAAFFTEGNLGPGEREDRGNRWVLGVFGGIGLLLGFLPAYTDRLDLWTFGTEAIRWWGVLLYALGGVLRIWPVFVLGKRFSGLVAIQPGHALVTTGIFARVRNPSYLGMLVNSLGWVLAFRSGVGVVLVVLMVPALIARIEAEETLLRSQFGQAYEDYCGRTWRLVPGVY